METTAELLNLDTTGPEPLVSDLTEMEGNRPIPNRSNEWGRTFPPDEDEEDRLELLEWLNFLWQTASLI